MAELTGAAAGKPAPAAVAAEPEDAKGTPGRGWTLFAASLGFAMVQLDVSVVNVAIKPIGAEFGGGVSALQWVVSAYTLAFAALILTAGALGDRVGAKRVFNAGFVVFMVASAACGLAPSLGVLIAARVVQGIGAAVLVPSSLSLLHHTFPDPGERTRAVGLWAAGASSALASGPLVGGLLIAAFGWRSIFFITVPIGLAGIALATRWAVETPRSRERGVDLPGQLAAVVALTALAAAMIEGGERGFADPAVLGGFALAAAGGAVFVALEAARADPMLPLRLFRSPTFSAASVIGLLVNVVFYGLIFVFSLFFQDGLHYSALQTGLAFAPVMAALTTANLVARRIAAAIGGRGVIAIGALLMTVGSGALLGIDTGTPYAALFIQLAVVGFGLGLVVPAMTSALLGSVDRSWSGVASGSLNTARQAGSVIGVALFGSLIAGDGRLVSGLHLTLAVCVVLAAAAAALTAALAKQ